MENNNKTSNYSGNVHTVGIISSLLVIASLVIVPLGAQIIFGQTVDWGPTLGAMGKALIIFGPVAVIEFLSYLPTIGAGGQYLSFTTGNVMNMKVPSAATGRRMVGVESGTEEGDVISMISIAVSSITTTAIVFLGMVVGSQMLPLLEHELLAPAFNNIMPAIMGALGVPMIVKSIKLASVPVAISVTLTVVWGYSFVSANQGKFMIMFLAVCLAWAYFLFKRAESKKTSEEQ